MRNLYDELAEYTGRDKQLVMYKCANANVELAWEFEKYKDNPLQHYRESDLYIFALTRYQRIMQEKGIHDWFKDVIRHYGWKTGLDYGGGIGEQTLLAFEAGVERMTFVEIEGSRTMLYARNRLSKLLKTGQKFDIQFGYEDFKVKEDYDFVIAMDVFEHIKDPKPIIENIAKHTKYIFCNPTEVRYNWLYPQHISKFDLEPYFKKVETYLYERR